MGFMNYTQSEEMISKLNTMTLAIVNLQCECAKTNYKLDTILLKMEEMMKHDNGRACGPLSEATQTTHEEKQDNSE